MMEVSPHIKAEFDASNDHALQALNQAASRAELAAQRLQANTAIPFSQRDFEAEHPGWSFPKQVTSSASTSRPSSAKGVTPSLRPSASSTGSTPDGPRKRGRPRKARVLGEGNLERRVEGSTDGKGRATRSVEGLSRGYGRRSSPFSNRHQLKSETASQRPMAAKRASAVGDDANGLSNPSSPSQATDSAIPMQTHLGETNGLGALADNSHHDLSTSRAKSDSLRDLYEEAVAPIIQSLTSQYVELYPTSDGRGIREEVCCAQRDVLAMRAKF